MKKKKKGVVILTTVGFPSKDTTPISTSNHFSQEFEEETC